MTSEICDWLQNHYFSLAEPVQKNEFGIFPLILAAQKGRLDIVNFLIEQKAELDAIDNYGNNALWAASYANSFDCITAMLKAGVAINYQNPASGATALIFAASSGREEVVEFLLKSGADPRLATLDDFTALDLASTRKILELIKTCM